MAYVYYFLFVNRKQSDASYFKNDLTWHIVVKADMKICGNRSYVK